jgi:hypothetical protein
MNEREVCCDSSTESDRVEQQCQEVGREANHCEEYRIDEHEKWRQAISGKEAISEKR